ncbi:MAG: hypothetical protein ABEJ65_12595, partial [bacterium]
MDNIGKLQSNLEEAEDWIHRLRKWTDSVDSDPALLGAVSVLKFLPSDGAQSAREKLENMLGEPQEGDVDIEGESEEHPEVYEIRVVNDHVTVTVKTRKRHRIELEATPEEVSVQHGSDESELFYPQMRERIEET